MWEWSHPSLEAIMNPRIHALPPRDRGLGPALLVPLTMLAVAFLPDLAGASAGVSSICDLASLPRRGAVSDPGSEGFGQQEESSVSPPSTRHQQGRFRPRRGSRSRVMVTHFTPSITE